MIKKKNPVEEHLDAAFNTVIEGPPRRRSLRVSSMPYCSLLDAMLPREPEQMDLSGALYTTMGTMCHENIQFFMSLGEHGEDVYGGWECPKCRKKYEYQFRPEPCCGTPLKYVELEFRLGPLSGHLDLLVCYRNREQRRAYAAALKKGKKPRIEGRWVAFEFKTTGRKPDQPKRQHEVQIRTYCEMLKKCFGIYISAYTIVYIGRENLARTTFGPFSDKKTAPITREWMWRSIKGFKAATKARNDATLENYMEVAEHRPCRCHEDYERYMSRRYDLSQRDCPMLPYCTKSTKRAAKAALEAVLA